MLIYYGVCAGLLGLIFGSFLNCTAMRIVRGEDFVKGRSHCMSCGHELFAPDLIPLFSYLVHKGRCRYCKAKISARYPITEFVFMLLSLGLYVAFIGFGFGSYITFFKYWVLTGCLFLIALTDLEAFDIPDGALLLGAVSWVIFTAVEVIIGVHDLKWAFHHLLAGLIIGGAMLLISLIMDKILGRDSLGGGDIKLYALLGLYLGYAGSYELIILSCILGLLFAGARKILFPESSKEFPFGPAIALGGYILLIFGDALTGWYLGLLT
ncbi:prepilin peptidase [Butyrivibrio sp. FCS006]|uniref:prepilin peptidase n=1 Tax=Butyrivibrio sp. FCS006 TaxID=1280684 RepID=UPI00047DE367|nr:A24 family peptidase [Butyrivibrio sp. FCS006]